MSDDLDRMARAYLEHQRQHEREAEERRDEKLRHLQAQRTVLDAIRLRGVYWPPSSDY